MMRILVTLILLVAWWSEAMAQTLVNADSTYLRAKQIWYSKSADSALTIARELVHQFPQHHDYRFLYVQLLLATKSCDSALTHFNREKLFSPNTKDDLDLEIRIYNCLENHDMVIQRCQLGISNFPGERNFYYFKKAESLHQLSRNAEALRVLDSISLPERNNAEIQYLRNKILQNKKRKVILSNQASLIDYNVNLMLAVSSLQYSFKKNKITHLPKFNTAHGIIERDFQAGYEFYRTLNKRTYLNAELSGSPGNIFFPVINTGAEVYRNHRRLEYSSGIRYLYFRNFGNTWIATGSLSWSALHWGISYRPHFVFIDTRVTHNQTLALRYSIWKKESYLRAEFQFGTAPFFNQSYYVTAKNSTVRAGVGGQFRLFDHYFIGVIAMHEWEEFFPDRYRNRFLLFTNLSYRF
jgi:YaiO family outer membrane protein